MKPFHVITRANGIATTHDFDTMAETAAHLASVHETAEFSVVSIRDAEGKFIHAEKVCGKDVCHK